MAKLPISRNPGESDVDYARRYCREKMRIYRANKPRSDKKRGPSRQMDPRSQLTEEQWLALRPEDGEDPKTYRKRYRREALKISRARRKDDLAPKRRARYAETKDHQHGLKRAWNAANPDRVKAYQKRYYDEHKEERNAKLKEWGERNADRLQTKIDEWWKKNPGRRSAYSSARRARERQATPLWADMEAILVIYDECVRITLETGIGHHVDHIVPLAGKTVCGLHVQTNLRIIPAEENLRKRNHLIEDLVA